MFIIKYLLYFVLLPFVVLVVLLSLLFTKLTLIFNNFAIHANKFALSLWDKLFLLIE